MAQTIIPTQREIVMREDDFIVTKTDTSGKLVYCNPIFIEFSGFKEHELLGKPHHVVRHPDMPRAVFQRLWNTIRAGDEFFGYIKNIAKDGSYYWVYATVTPSYANNVQTKLPEIIGYFSVRRKPRKNALATMESIYRDMSMAEKNAGRHDALTAGMRVLNDVLEKSGKNYNEFILTLD